MSVFITTCPDCGHAFEEDMNCTETTCPRCGRRYWLFDDDEPANDNDPDYGGAFDGHTVTSDADPGL